MAQLLKPGANVTGPFSNNTYIPTTTHGWVHANTWYASVPFNSAPPPVPQGVNPQIWQNGHWLPNPMFRLQPGMTQASVQMWAPHPTWGQTGVNQGQSQGHNPNKRKPNPGDATYWATKLSDNPLGLENMHIRDDTPANERHIREQSNGVPHTPWMWVPKELKAPNMLPQSNGFLAPPGAQMQQPQQADKALPPPPPSQSQSSRDHVRNNSSSRPVYEPPPVIPPPPPDMPPQSRPRDFAPSSAPPTMSSYSAYHQQQQQQQQRQQDSQRSSDRHHPTSHHHSNSQQQQPPQPAQSQPPEASQYHSRHYSRDASPRPPTAEPQSYSSRDYRSHTTSSASSSASAAAASAAASRSATTPVRTPARTPVRSATVPTATRDYDDEAFSGRRDLLPTFSPSIVRTPDHYSSPPTRHMSHDDVDRTPSRTPGSHGNIYGPPSRSNSLSARRQASTPSSAGTSTSTTPTGSSGLGLLTFTEEPQALLSPLVVGGTPPESKISPSREVSRSRTYPSGNSVKFFLFHEETEGKAYPRTPRFGEDTRSRELEPEREWERERESEQDWGRERDRDRDRTRDRDRERDRDRDARATPYATPTRTPPSKTPPSSYSRPSPESGSGHHARQISRSFTYPSGAPVLPSPPSHSTSPRYNTSPHSQSQPYSSSSSYPSSSYTRTSPNTGAERSRGSSPLRHNPLPRPPAVSAYTEQLVRGSSSASAAAAVHQPQPAPKREVRHGYWNRRGDHLYVTDKGERFVVYAPRSFANPEDLKQYPSPTDGWQDHRGDFIKYDPNVPELLDSLPLQGREPIRPYNSFVCWIEV